MSNPGERKCQGSKTSSQCITREQNLQQRKKITTSFSYMGHNIKQCAFLAIRGGGAEWPINNQTGPFLLPSYPSRLYQSTYKIWKQSD